MFLYVETIYIQIIQNVFTSQNWAPKSEIVYLRYTFVIKSPNSLCVPNFTFFSLVDLEKTGSDRQTDTK